MNPYKEIEMRMQYTVDYNTEDDIIINFPFENDPQKEECEIFIAVLAMISFLFFIGMIGAIIYAYTH